MFDALFWYTGATASSCTRSGTFDRQPIWKLETALKCRSCRKGRDAPRQGQPSNRPIGDAWRTFFCPSNNKTVRQFSNHSATRIATRGVASMLRERSVVYYPEELSLLGHVLDQAIKSLPAAMRTPYNRTEIARNILACAATGERDPIELELAATIDLKVSTAA